MLLIGLPRAYANTNTHTRTGPDDGDRSDKLNKLLGSRPSMQDLRKKNLLPEAGIGVNVAQAQKHIQKAQEKQRLSDFLEHRPTLE